MSRRARRGDRKRSNAVYIIPILVVVTAVVGYYIFTQSGTTGGNSGLNGHPVSADVLNYLSGVSVSTLNQVGKGAAGVNSPTATTGASPLTFNGKPEVLYMGAEYCPFCAAERWSMIVALDKFGNFTGLQYMQSSSTDTLPSTPTFTFVGATYTSNYISFVTIEQQDRNYNVLQTATAQETSLLNTYDTAGTIPFVDFANQYAITSSQFTPAALRVGGIATAAPLNWTQVAPQLNNASSSIALNVDGAANKIISAICKIDGGAPSSVCSQGLAQTLSYARAPPSGGSQLIVSDAVLRGTTPSVVTSRFAPTRLNGLV
jgi:thiol-disulfide isomerase/thioredoxin